MTSIHCTDTHNKAPGEDWEQRVHMDTIFITIISVSAIGFLCAAIITIASNLMFVKVDVRVEKIRNCLPGANCGACGFSGCDGYADALVKDGIATNLCPPGGNTTLEQINEILGVSTCRICVLSVHLPRNRIGSYITYSLVWALTLAL